MQLPAKVVTVCAGSEPIFRIQLLSVSATNTFPAASAHTDDGFAKCAESAETGCRSDPGTPVPAYGALWPTRWIWCPRGSAYTNEPSGSCATLLGPGRLEAMVATDVAQAARGCP